MIQELRESPTLPADFAKCDKPIDLDMYNIRLPPVHCALRNCTWVGKRHLDLKKHLVKEHTDDLGYRIEHRQLTLPSHGFHFFVTDTTSLILDASQGALVLRSISNRANKSSAAHLSSLRSKKKGARAHS